MRIKIPVFLFLLTSGLWGCSSLSLPSMPSIPWSKSAQGDQTAEVLFQEGTNQFNSKRYTRALDSFQKVKTEHPFSPLVTQAELKIADSYSLNKQYSESIAAFKEFVDIHPTNENIPFVIYRLGQAHFDQFSSTDRDQKNTEIAKNYFESVIKNHPKSPYVADAREKLEKCNEYLAEYEFNVAYFYFQQEKYLAARERFEEIVRRYQGTPAIVKSLFYLGETYRKEKNGLKAALAYEAILQHYPQSKFAGEAKTQLAQLDKEKHDPLAILLHRERRPAYIPETDKTAQETATAKMKELNLVTKKEVVHEEPGNEKALVWRVVDKINPFAPSGSDKKEEKRPESANELLAKNKESESKSVFAWLNPFGGRDSKEQKIPNNNSGAVMSQVDDSLRQKGIDASAQQGALKPPPADLPKVEEPLPQTMDPAMLSQIDSRLQKSGKSVGESPAPPEAAEVFKNPAAAQAVAAQLSAKKESDSGDLLSSIDQKLKRQGVETANFELPPPAPKENAPRIEQAKTIELQPKLAVEKGPLFLGPAEVETQQKPAQSQGTAEKEKQLGSLDNKTQQEPIIREFPKSLVKGPQQASSAARPAEQKKPAPGQEEETKGMFDRIREDAENIGKLLNPFRW